MDLPNSLGSAAVEGAVGKERSDDDVHFVKLNDVQDIIEVMVLAQIWRLHVQIR
jgi:hypothetical protein